MNDPEPVYRPTDHPAPAGRVWAQVDGSQARVIIDAPPGDLLDQADEADLSAALVYTAKDGWHLQPPAALEIAVMATGCQARELRDGAVLVCRRPEQNHRGRHKWRPLPVETVDLPADPPADPPEPQPLEDWMTLSPSELVEAGRRRVAQQVAEVFGPEPVEVDVPVVDRATGEPVLLGTEVECGAGHMHDHTSTAAACDRAAPAGSLQDLTDGEPDPEPEPAKRDEHIYRSFVQQGYSPAFAHRKALERWALR